MVYIITTESFPNGLAATQRIKCYAKSIVSLGTPCEVLCMNRCEDPAKPLGNIQPKGKIDGYKYRYIGGSTLIRKFWQNRFNQLLDSFLLIIMMLFSFSRKDKVIFYSYNPTLLKIVEGFSMIKGFEVYFELNEHPSVLRSIFGAIGESSEDMLIIKSILGKVDGVLCISLSLKALLIKCGIPENKIHVINMLVDSSRFAGIMKQSTETYVGYCGAADNNKDGVNQLIKAFSRIAPKHPGLKLYIVGPKNDDSSNEDLAKKLGIENNVVFTGIVRPDSIPQLLVNAQVLALARPQSVQAQYGFPTKLGEYLLTGNPVVVTNVGEISYYLRNKETAYLADADDIDDFANQLDMALTDEKAPQIGLNGRIIAETYFTGDMVKSQLKIALGL